MKKIVFALVLLVLLSSCSKEAMINRKLDGSWNAVTVENTAVQNGESYNWTFSKNEQTTGTGTSSYTGTLGTYNYSFIYTLTGDQLTMTTTVGNSSSTETVTINVYKNDKIQWTDSDGRITVLEPK